MDAPENENSGLVDLGVAASLARLHARDQREFLDSLAAMLSGVLPDEAVVEKSGSLFGGRRIGAVEVPLGDNLYRLEAPARGSLRATRTRVVRGIRLRTDSLPVEEWLAALSEALGQYAEEHLEARDALKRFVGE